MCYISTDRDIEDIPFDEKDPKFNVKREEVRLPCFTKRFVYYCGSSMSCGCGFVGNDNITDDILQRTEQELQSGELTEATQWLWWDQNEPPPNSKEEFDEWGDFLRSARQDTAALYCLIEETCKAGFDCELLACWAGSENEAITKTFLVHADNERIYVDFKSVHDSVDEDEIFLYRFVTL
jgi:hypothetical protein